MQKISAREFNRLVSRVDQLVQRFGKNFKNEYGWAADVLRLPNPRFAQIEESLGSDHWRPYYKMASHSVHAGPKGVFFSLSLNNDSANKMLLAGPSNSGFTDPAQGTAISLLRLTTLLLIRNASIDNLVWMHALQKLTSDVGTTFLDRQVRLDDLEAKLRSSRKH